MAPRTNTSLINAERISKSFGIKPLLDEVSVGVHEGERIGVVGLNGGGKTTLLEILAGITEVDSGRLSRAGGIHVATVTQRGDLDPDATVADAVIGRDVPEHEWAGTPESAASSPGSASTRSCTERWASSRAVSVGAPLWPRRWSPTPTC